MTDHQEIYEITRRLTEAGKHDALAAAPPPPPPIDRTPTPLALVTVAAVVVSGWIGWGGGADYERAKWQTAPPVSAAQPAAMAVPLPRLPEIEILDLNSHSI